MNEPLVSIICNTYNHEPYIRQTLDGIVMQKTDFPFEVLIHDDASTDNTADIIREYEERYPELIKPIYQTENQYSRHIKIMKSFQYPRAKGRYLAFCEGDDFWTDLHKLQKQVEALEAHPEVDMCAHASTVLYPNGREVVISKFSEPTIVPTDDIILHGGLFVSTCSIMFRKSMLDKEWRFYEFWGYDQSRKILGSLRGGILCLPDNMATYRFMSGPDSWTSRVLKDSEKEIAHTKKRIQLLEYLDEDTNGKYRETIDTAKRELAYKILWYEGDYRSMRKQEYADLFRKLTPKKKALVYTGVAFPWLAKFLHKGLINKHLKGRMHK